MAFDKLENMIKDTPQKYLIQNTFGGQTCAIKTCGKCGKVEETYDPFFVLTL